MKNKMMIALMAILLTLCSCGRDVYAGLTFEDIEKEFAFKKPFTEISKKRILENYGDLENYRKILSQQISEISIKKRENELRSPMATYKVTLYNELVGLNATIDCDNDTYVLDAAEANGIDLPYSCRAGACSSCVGKIHNGVVYYADQTFLCDNQIAQGWIPLCVSSPESDCTITPWMEEMLPSNCNPSYPHTKLEK